MNSPRLALLSAVLLAGCAAPPLGPLVQVIPGPGKSYGQFQYDDGQCRAAAQSQTAGQAKFANDRAVGGAVLSTALGAGLGAIVGGGRGAAVGAVTGAGIGTGLGAGTSAGAQGGIQAQYDNVYAQCMYANGNQVPGLIAPSYQEPDYQQQSYQQQSYRRQSYRQPAYAGSYGARDPLVGDIQEQLRRLGYYNGAVDGLGGLQTTSAIQSFQASHNLQPDGVPSPYLYDALRNTAVGY